MSFGQWLTKQLEDANVAKEYAAAQHELALELAFSYVDGPLRLATATTSGLISEHDVDEFVFHISAHDSHGVLA